MTIKERLEAVQEEFTRLNKRYGCESLDKYNHEEAVKGRHSENIVQSKDMFQALSEDGYYLSKAGLELTHIILELLDAQRQLFGIIEQSLFLPGHADKNELIKQIWGIEI